MNKNINKTNNINFYSLVSNKSKKTQFLPPSKNNNYLSSNILPQNKIYKIRELHVPSKFKFIPYKNLKKDLPSSSWNNKEKDLIKVENKIKSKNIYIKKKCQ